MREGKVAIVTGASQGMGVAHDYKKKLWAHGLRPSMSGKGNCYDNAFVETFCKSLKAELI